ncbi:outer membrane lipoprotein-sorting protein [Desulfospira joergensenii]|uniref:outer membrane lipoprotein-sorting protein n=1 Tax=Desulfospira joergensenii TaxID=53329 RepID=UPI0003B76CBF|nr:outer membrane lipoprotein-sorting protein [Desulfospira joergensenii]
MKNRVLILALILALVPSAAATGEPDAETIITRAWDYMRGKTSVSVVRMTVHRPDWERTSVIKAWTRGREKSIFQIISPKKDKGNGTLKIDRDMWTYNPKINRVVKIPPSMMSQSWMGSDFSNNDLSKADTILVDYTHEIAGTQTREGFTVYEIKSIPRPGAPVIWGMQKLKIREDGVLMEQAFFDEDMEAIKIMTTSEIRNMGGRTFPGKWIMRSMDAGSKEDYTLLEYESLDFDVPLQENFFTLNALKKPLR